MNKKTIVLLILTALLSACGGGDDTSKMPSIVQPSGDLTLTDEQNVDIPESEVIFQKASDGYTYNEPQPIQDDWIIEPATDDYPATIDESKLSSSWFVPANYDEYLDNKTSAKATLAGVLGHSNRIIQLNFENLQLNKLQFTNFITNFTDLEFVFLKVSQDSKGTYINFLITSGTENEVLIFIKDLNSNSFKSSLDYNVGIASVYSYLLPEFSNQQKYVELYNQATIDIDF